MGRLLPGSYGWKADVGAELRVDDVREVGRVPYVGAEHHLRSLNNLVAVPIGRGLKRHLAIFAFRGKVEMVSAFAEVL
jgi:hypothetical protein